MSSLSWVRCFIWVLLHTSIEYQGADGIKTILNQDECVVQDPEGKKYYLTTLRNDDESPRFQASRNLSYPGVVYQYSYNPCISFSLGPKKESEFADCQYDVAICMWLDNHAYYKIAKQSTMKCGFYGEDKIPALHYTGDGRIQATTVLLKCNQTKVTTEQAIFDVWRDHDAGRFFFNLTHKCACPDACLITPDGHVVEIAVSAGIAVLIVALIVIWLVRRRQDNNGYENINGQNGVEESDNEFPDTSEGTSGRGSESVTRLSPMGSSCSDITAPKKQNKDNLNSKIKTYTDALC